MTTEPIPIQDGREMKKSQNGLGVGEPGDPMYTLDTTGAQSVCYEIPEPPYLIDGRREDDFRVFDEYSPALMARMGTGGNNVPIVVVDGNE